MYSNVSIHGLNIKEIINKRITNNFLMTFKTNLGLNKMQLIIIFALFLI